MIRKTTFLLLALLLLVCSAPFAQTPAPPAPKAEIGFAGELTNPKAAPTIWHLEAELLGPIFNGHVVAGPTLNLYDDSSLATAGAALEWNLDGQRATPFIGAEGTYLIQKPDTGDRQAVIARAGLKIPLTAGGGAALKVYAHRIVNGRGETDADTGVTLGVLARF